MRTLWIAFAAATALSALAVAQPPTRACCDLWIFEAANGPDSYAVRLQRSGRTFLVTPSPAGAQVLEGKPAQEALQRWIAIGRLAESTSILLDARESRISLGADGLDVDVVDPPDAAGNDDANTLIFIRNATRAQTRKFIGEMPQLTDAARTRFASAVGED